MQIKSIMSLIDKLNTKLIILFCHHNADPDAICAAYAFFQFIKYSRPQIKIEIAAAQGPSRLSKHLLNVLPIKLTSQPCIEEADLIVLLDTNTIQQLDTWSERVKNSGSPIVVIDHHSIHPKTERLAKIYAVDEEASSTCEIIYSFFKEMKVELKENEAKALFLGIAFDTKHFILANSVTFKIVAELVDGGVNPKEALALLSLPLDFSERVARLKACQRLKIKRVKKWLIALSRISSYQASVANFLIKLGAHISIVGGKRGNELRISLRSCQDFHKETGIHLGRDIAKPLGYLTQGVGGGHSTSAGVNGLGDVRTSFEHFMAILVKELK